MRVRSKIQVGSFRLLRRGFTLIEMGVVLVLSLLIASTSVTMLNQQVSFYQWLNSQNFLLQEAPVTNSLVVRILSQADAFRIHSIEEDALSDTNGLTTGGKVLVVGFSQPDGSQRYGLLKFEKEDGDPTGIFSYSPLNEAGTAVASTWTITSGAADIEFGIVNGILIIEMTGPYGGQLTYAATSSL